MWCEWENWYGWGVCHVHGQFNPRGIQLRPLEKRYTRSEAKDIARRLNAKDPAAFKLLSKKQFV